MKPATNTGQNLTNIVLAIAAICGIAFGMTGIFISRQALDKSEDANRIARYAQIPDITLNIYESLLLLGYTCDSKNADYHTIHMVLVGSTRITFWNRGGRGALLIDAHARTDSQTWTVEAYDFSGPSRWPFKDKYGVDTQQAFVVKRDAQELVMPMSIPSGDAMTPYSIFHVVDWVGSTELTETYYDKYQGNKVTWSFQFSDGSKRNAEQLIDIHPLTHYGDCQALLSLLRRS